MAKKKIEPRCYELADLEGMSHSALIELLMDENVIKDRLGLAAMTEISNLRYELNMSESFIEDAFAVHPNLDLDVEGYRKANTI